MSGSSRAQWVMCNVDDANVMILKSKVRYSTALKKYRNNAMRECVPAARGVSKGLTCQRCSWFDSLKLDRSGGAAEDWFAHVAFDIQAKSCLQGSFTDAVDAKAWAQRDFLVHKKRYVAECKISAADDNWLVLWRACLTICIFFGCVCCAFIRRRHHLLRQDTVEPSNKEEGSPWKRSRRPNSNHRDFSAFSQREQSEDTSTLLKFAVPAGAPAKAHQIIQDIHEDLLDKMDAPMADRKNLIRKYLMQWHPDKNVVEDKEIATAVIQFLNAKKDWFLNPTVFPETATLLP